MFPCPADPFFGGAEGTRTPDPLNRSRVFATLAISRPFSALPPLTWDDALGLAALSSMLSLDLQRSRPVSAQIVMQSGEFPVSAAFRHRIHPRQLCEVGYTPTSAGTGSPSHGQEM